MVFHSPWILLFIPPVFLSAYLIKRRQRPAAIWFSSTEIFPNNAHSFKIFLGRNLIYIRAFIIALMLIALSRPQHPVKESIRRTEGIDIVLTLDVSTSMLAEDFNIGKKRYSRMDIVKKTVSEFVPKRTNDRLAVVVFGARPYTTCPLTLNHDWLIRNLDRVYAGMLEDRTAIGSAVVSSVKRLERSKANDKVIILLTDGRNNAGEVTPMTAAEIAKTLNIKIYTIGAGMSGSVPYPVKDSAGQITGYTTIKLDIDEDLLKKMADKTGGRYFRATDTESLKKIYDDIDNLEKVPITEKGFDEYDERFGRFLLPALFILFLEIILSNTMLQKIP